jgi:hypothetical protein
LAEDKQPDRERHQTNDDRCKDQPLRGFISQQLRRGARVLRFLDELHDLSKCRVGADFRRAVVKGAGFVHRGADDGVADFFLDRHRFAGEHGLVDVRQHLR